MSSETIMAGASLLNRLTLLRTFDAAARRLSFRDAAADLHVTPSAVSHQIRRLEQEIGTTLFIRHNRRIELSAHGDLLHSHVLRGFAELERGLHAVDDAVRTRPLRISVAPSFAATYLNSRLNEFERLNPDIPVQLDMTNALMDLETGIHDVVVRHGTEAPSDLFAEELASVSAAPVCSPDIALALLGGRPLGDVTRVVVTPARDVWDRWHAFVGDEPPEVRRGISFDTLVEAIHATIEGAGIAIAPLEMVERHLVAGTLVRPYPQIMANASAYRLICRHGHERSARVLRFRRWLRQAMAERRQ